MDDAAAFDAALLAEVARLLPEADVVHVVEHRRSVDDVPVATARRRVEDASREVAAHAITAWTAAYPGVAPPVDLTVDLALVDDGRVRVTATAVRRNAGPPVRLDADVIAAALAATGWTTERRPASAGAVNVLGALGQLRLDVAARPTALVALRVSTAAIEVGAVAASIAAQPRRLVPWPVSR